MIIKILLAYSTSARAEVFLFDQEAFSILAQDFNARFNIGRLIPN